VNNKTQKTVLAALFAALVCVATMVVRIPSPKGYINLGDSIVLLSGWLLSPVYGFFAAAIGSMLADLLLGYTAYAPITFIIKGIMALVAFLFAKKVFGRNSGFVGKLLGGLCAEIIMVLGYFVFEGFLYSGEGGFATALLSVPFNGVQGIVGMIVGLLLVKVFEKAKITK